MSSYTLEHLGWRPWLRVSAAENQYHWFWCDLDGAHVNEPLPQEPPLGTTHLWGWAASEWIRWRLDGDAAAGSVLRRLDGDDGPLQVHPRRAFAWPPEDGHADLNPATVHDKLNGRALFLRVLPVPHSLTFLEVRP